MARRRSDDEVERKIHFFRADTGTDSSGTPVAFDPTKAFQAIDKMSFDVAGRYHEYNDNVYCCWVDRATAQQRVRLAVIRRSGLPFVEERGVQSALNIPAAAGLVEQCHIIFFPNRIVGCEFNFYGPRMARMSSYLSDKAKKLCPPVAFEPLLRQDISKQLSDLGSLRVLHMRVRRAYVDTIKEADQGLGAAFDAAKEASDAEEIELILRPSPYSSTSLSKKMLKAVSTLAKRDDIKDIASSFDVEGYPPDGGKREAIDLLGDAFITTTTILRQDKRSRALDSASAYSEIRSAYNDLKDDLVAAASLAQ